MSRFTCPYCLRSYSNNKIPYICPLCNTEAKVRTFFYLYREPIKCKSASCKGMVCERRCPRCGRAIPREVVHTPNLPFSIVGVSNAGKTNYITVMLRELENIPNLKLSVGPITDKTGNIQSRNLNLIYNLHRPPESTNTGTPEAQIWLIQNLSRQFLRWVPSYTFTIYDGAGEDHQNHLRDNSDVCRYISESKAIILVVDPLVLVNVRNTVDPDVMRNSLGQGNQEGIQNAATIINSVVSYIKQARGVSVRRKLSIPVAVVFTKFDAVLNHQAFGVGTLVKESSFPIRKDGTVNLNEFLQVDGEIRNWLRKIGEGGVITALDAQFKEYLFFGVSSYGAPPRNGRTPDEIKPHRVLDPMLWLLNKAKFVK